MYTVVAAVCPSLSSPSPSPPLFLSLRLSPVVSCVGIAWGTVPPATERFLYNSVCIGVRGGGLIHGAVRTQALKLSGGLAGPLLLLLLLRRWGVSFWFGFKPCLTGLVSPCPAPVFSRFYFVFHAWAHGPHGGHHAILHRTLWHSSAVVICSA